MRILLTQLLLIALASTPVESSFISSFSEKRHTAQWKTADTPLFSQAPEFGLYEVQEKLLVDKGIQEEEFMRENSSPLAANKPKGLGSSGGFGGASKGSNRNLKPEGKSHGKVLQKDGVVRIDGVLSDKVADELRAFVMDCRVTSEKEIEEGTAQELDRFANVLLRMNRCDLKLPMEPIVKQALKEILCQSSVKATIENRLGTKPALYELASLISDPGSQRQNIHPDNPYIEQSDMDPTEPTLLTCFVALQDVTMEMGPTVWLPGTHTKEAHAAFKNDSISLDDDVSPKNKLLQSSKAVLGLLPKGSCAIFDSRCLHAGSANRSDGISRGLFYFSFRNPKVRYPGNPGTLRKELETAQLDLPAIVKDLKKFKK